jgi:hypothetical protein
MLNEYKMAEVVELGRAQDIVLGEKASYGYLDSVTFEFGTRYKPATDD